MLNKLCLISAPRHYACAVVYTTPVRSYSQEIKTLSSPDPARLKRGTGGRSSFNGNVVTVFGATGFFGRFIVNQLGKRGCQIIIPTRSNLDDYQVKKLKLAGDLGQILFQPFDLRDPVSIRKSIKYSNIVINLIGSDTETMNFDFHAVHVKGAREIAKACREMNIERLIHFSALNVTEKPERYYVKKLQFLPTKLHGERAVFEEYPNATVFRPSNMYGHMDRFLWPLCTSMRHFYYSIPLYANGEKTIKQPVFASDVAMGVMNAINDYDTRGKIYQAVGLEKFYLKDIAIFCSQILQRHVMAEELVHDIRFNVALPLRLFLTGIFWVFHRHPMSGLCFETIERESVTDVLDNTLPTLVDLGVVPATMEEKVPHLIMESFMADSNFERAYVDYLPADSLSAKAVNEYSI